MRFHLLNIATILAIVKVVRGTTTINTEDAYLNFPEFCAKFGYPVETHTIQTIDGYLLTNFRIPFSKKSPLAQKPKRVVLLQHGLMASADCFVLNTADRNLAFLLADAGYDVWLNNARGIPYSRRHIKLRPDEAKFWKFRLNSIKLTKIKHGNEDRRISFQASLVYSECLRFAFNLCSFHEMGVYDIPAVINYILRKTGEQTLSYVAHSMGTTMFWIAMSTYPELNSKIRIMIAMAPISYIWNVKAPLFRIAAPLLEILPEKVLVKALSVDGQAQGEFSPQGRLYQLSTACESQLSAGCKSFYQSFFGFDPIQFNETQIPVYMGHFPTSSSAYTFIHYGQLTNSRRFCQYDYGPLENIRKYGSIFPPDYNLSKVTAKVAIFWSLNDYLSDPADVILLGNALPNLIHLHQVQWLKFNHGDYMSAIDIVPLVHEPLMRILRDN